MTAEAKLSLLEERKEADEREWQAEEERAEWELRQLEARRRMLEWEAAKEGEESRLKRAWTLRIEEKRCEVETAKRTNRKAEEELKAVKIELRKK